MKVMREGLDMAFGRTERMRLDKGSVRKASQSLGGSALTKATQRSAGRRKNTLKVKKKSSCSLSDYSLGPCRA